VPEGKRMIKASNRKPSTLVRLTKDELRAIGHGSIGRFPTPEVPPERRAGGVTDGCLEGARKRS
jgi:hypothetical protein